MENDKRREARLRRKAKQRCLRLRRSQGGYMLEDSHKNIVMGDGFTSTLYEIENYFSRQAIASLENFKALLEERLLESDPEPATESVN